MSGEITLSPGAGAAEGACAWHAAGWWLPVVGVLSAALCIPFVHGIFSFGDEGVLLHGAERMLHGDTIYLNFFEFLPPGGFVLTEMWLRVAGISLVSARSLAVLSIAAIACFTFLACRRTSREALLSATLTIGWVVMSQGLWTQVSHHWFTTMFSMIGLWAGLRALEDAERRWRWPFVAGVTIGAACMITPTCGALAGIAGMTMFLTRRHRAALIVYVVGGAAVPAGLVLWLAWQGALIAAFQDVILFTANQYASIQGVAYGSWANQQNAPLAYVFPAAAALAVIAVACDGRAVPRDNLIRACLAFGIAGFVASFPRPDISHIGFEAPLALPLLAGCAARLRRSLPVTLQCAAAGVLVIAFITPVMAFARLSVLMASGEPAPMPRGDAVFFELPGAPSMIARIATLPPEDGVFFYPFMPLMPFVTGHTHVSQFDLMTPGYSLPAQYREACYSAVRRARWLVIDRMWTDPAMLKSAFPAMRDARPPEVAAFEQALDTGFDFVARDGTFELRRLRNNASSALCDGIGEQR